MDATSYLPKHFRPKHFRAEPYGERRRGALPGSVIMACAVLLIVLIGGEIVVRAKYFPSVAGESPASLDLW